jgi:2-desacetyl-2-hydroxyethyl bacteriochlorophyllide A dehydrogenase
VTGRRLLFAPDRSVEVEEFEVPEPGPGQILVTVTRSHVSAGTELRSFFAGGGDDRVPLGYEAVGRVAAVGPDVADYAEGDRVLTYGHHASHWLVDRNDASVVGLRRFIAPIPDGVSDDAAGFAIHGDVALHAVRRSGVELDEPTAVFGLGMIGQLTVRLAHVAGAGPIVAFDPNPLRRERALAGGAASAAVSLRELTGGESPRTIFLCAPAAQLLAEAAEAAADRGTIIVVGIPTEVSSLSMRPVIEKELTIRGVFETGLVQPHWYWPWSPERNRLTCLRLMAAGELRVDDLVTHVVPPEGVEAALDMILDRRRSGEWLGVVVSWA